MPRWQSICARPATRVVVPKTVLPFGRSFSAPSSMDDPEIALETREAYSQSLASSQQAKRAKSSKLGDLEDPDDYSEENIRTHPLTEANKYGPFPNTVFLPDDTFTKPIQSLFKLTSIKHIREACESSFGGPGLPYSPLTPRVAMNMHQRPVRLVPGVDAVMSSIQANASLAAVFPAAYAASRNVIVEVRRKLGRDWIRRLITKKSKRGPKVLDAGSGGAAILAWNEVMEAEIGMMEEDDKDIRDKVSTGAATVVAASHHMREKCAQVLGDAKYSLVRTIPTLEDDEAKKSDSNYDVIFVPYSLWAMEYSQKRRKTIRDLWSQLNPNGGVIILIEKGTPRGFEVIAEARKQLLGRINPRKPQELNITWDSTDSTNKNKPSPDSQSDPLLNSSGLLPPKEAGAIIAPCSTHAQCPMYPESGLYRNRKDFCHFSQRVIRPPFLQKILQASERNHTDIEFSYLAMIRGRDLRKERPDFVEGEDATLAALKGYELPSGPLAEMLDKSPVKVLHSTKALPRAILPALKYKGYILLDVCTPSGTLERWTIPKSFSKQAFRDGRKIQWGDLWPLGAKGRAERNMRLGTVVKKVDGRDADRAVKDKRREIKRLRKSVEDEK